MGLHSCFASGKPPSSPEVSLRKCAVTERLANISRYLPNLSHVFIEQHRVVLELDLARFPGGNMRTRSPAANVEGIPASAYATSSTSASAAPISALPWPMMRFAGAQAARKEKVTHYVANVVKRLKAALQTDYVVLAETISGC